MSIGITLYICAANEHIAFIERDVRRVKQIYRAIRHGLPYTTMPSLMVIHLVMFVYFWLDEETSIGISPILGREERQ